MIELIDVVKSYGNKVVLSGIHLKINTGETKIILGASGSGKSTVLKLILGLDKPDSGKILVNDQDITQLDESELMDIRQRFGMVFQEAALFDSMTVKENVGYRLYEHSDASPEEIEETVRRMLGFVGLEDAIEKMPAELSGGMKRRVSLARALVGHPKILLYDEPTAGLDPVTSRSILELLIKLRDLEGVTALLVTHDLKAVRVFANEYAQVKDGSVDIIRGDSICLLNIRFVILYEGKVRFEGTQTELLNSTDEYVRKFISL
jgi:phospholipid/cholesterol/gamma-HCH transport system ATP-binding protein